MKPRLFIVTICFGFIGPLYLQSEERLASPLNLKKLGIWKTIEPSLKKALPESLFEQLLGEHATILIQRDDTLKSDGLFTSEFPNQLFLRPRAIQGIGSDEVVLHELFHLIHFQLKPNEENFLREGLAQYFTSLVLGRAHGVNVAAAFRNPHLELLSDYDYLNLRPAWDGKAFLFVSYFLRRCTPQPGPERSSIQDRLNFFWRLVGYGHQRQTTKTGLDWLASQCRINVKEIFRDFAIATAFNRVTNWRENSYFLTSTTLKAVASKQASSISPWNFQILDINITETNFQQIKQNWGPEVQVYTLSDRYPFSLVKITSYDDLKAFHRIVGVRFN